MTVAADRRSAIAAHYLVLSRPNPGSQRLRLRGLDPAASYRVSVWPQVGATGDGTASPTVLGGDELMAAGLVLEANRSTAEKGDFRARLYVLEAI